jgi:hypothetical protein
MARAVRKLLVIGPVRDDVAALEQVLAQPAAASDTIAVVGDLGTAWSAHATYRATFRTLGGSNRPAFWIPGPIDDLLREGASMQGAADPREHDPGDALEVLQPAGRRDRRQRPERDHARQDARRSRPAV